MAAAGREDRAVPAAGREDRAVPAAVQACERQQMNEDILAWYLKTSKLALALAIIGSTPPGKSSRVYAEQLASSLCQKGVEWKLKAEAWKAEVLHLRQELFLTRMQSTARSNDGTGKHVIMLHAIDIFIFIVLISIGKHKIFCKKFEIM
ncbi:meiosis-specific protein MEI4 [Pristis pectinata]|uniref:meiosis-specific protein MEI4 n=1 Tax=Pristis pectinata TaxID=685728 RepID=UPI00223D869B|nr:meiosis-specific protein MEI4 [Pristis pectinata]